MNPFEDNSPGQPPAEPEPSSESQESLAELAARIVVHAAEPAAPGDAVPFEDGPVSVVLPAPPAAVPLPPDLSLPWPFPQQHLLWSWLHFICFGIFCLGSLLVIQLGLFILYSSGKAMSVVQFEQLFQSKPGVAIGMNVCWFFLIFASLYFSLPVFSGFSFWRTLCWRKLVSSSGASVSPWLYFGGGLGLAVAVAIVSSRLKTPENLPIQDLLKSRTGALLLMSMAVFVAPLVEETVFRGYLYPLFACSYSRVMRFFGGDPEVSFRIGSAIAIVLTGGLFGLMHGVQLGWTPGLVAMLVAVGIVFTFVRARAGTVLASFLLHLGYNSMIAFSAIVSTHGFTQMPPHP